MIKGLIKHDRYLSWLVLGLVFVFLVAMVFLSEGSYGGADELHHWRISKFSWIYPHLFFDLWGKPLFNFLGSPFAQFGIQGLKFFNVLAGMLTVFFSLKIIKKLDILVSVWLILAIVFTPIYLAIMLTGMTEILFSLILVLSVYLFLSNRYILFAVVASFLPFARNEGVVLFPLFVLVLSLKKEFRSILFLASGWMVVTLCGLWFYHDFLWIFHQSPYGVGPSMYGHGELFHFVKNIPWILGMPITLFFIIGLTILLWNLKVWDLDRFIWIILIPGSFLLFFAAHSYVWWKGIGASLGLIRVIASVTPLAAITAAIGLNVIIQLLPVKRIQTGAVIIFSIVILFPPFHRYTFPVPISSDMELIKTASQWLDDSEFRDKKFYYYDPYFFYYRNVSPYDESKIHGLVPDRENPQTGIELNELVLWDAHYSPNEGGLPLDRLAESKYFRKIHVFRPRLPFKTLNNINYEIYIFQRIDPDNPPPALPDSVIDPKNNQRIDLLLKVEDFELKPKNYSSGCSPFSGINAGYFKDGVEFCGADLNIETKNLKKEKGYILKASCMVSVPDWETASGLLLALEAIKNNKIVVYTANRIDSLHFIPNSWNEITVSLDPEYLPRRARVHTYIWNQKKKRACMDDLKLVYHFTGF
jgi:hypothetical protein